jgi:hypothetical protein
MGRPASGSVKVQNAAPRARRAWKRSSFETIVTASPLCTRPIERGGPPPWRTIGHASFNSRLTNGYCQSSADALTPAK